MLAKKSWAHYYGLRLADSAIYETISHLKEGQISFADDVRFEVEPEEVFGELSFDSETGEPYSTNNLEGNAGVTGWNGTSVPPRFCHLVAVGHYYGLTVVRQALVKDPPFPYLRIPPKTQTNTIDKTEIFNIDLNTLISIDQRLEMMLHTTVPWQEASP